MAKNIALGFLSFAVIFLMAGNLLSEQTPPKEIPQNNPQTTTNTLNSILEVLDATEKSYNDQFNIYIDRFKKYSVLYPKNLLVRETGPEGINFEQKGTDGPWLINISVNETTAKNVHDWLEKQNKQRGSLPPMSILKTEQRDGTTLLLLKNPIAVDEKDGKPIYDSMDTAIIMKNNEIFSIKKRELWKNAKEFDQVVANFHLLK